MHPLYQPFLAALQAEDKHTCVDLALDSIRSKEIDLVTLYTDVIIPALRETERTCDLGGLCVWKTRVRSSIVRTVMECCYPLVVHHAASPDAPKVIVVSPAEEFDDIEARMYADYLTLTGHDVIFVGSDTPTSEIIQALGLVKPAHIVLVVSNFYSIVEIQNIISQLKTARQEQKLSTRIIVAGQAFPPSSDLPAKVGADSAVVTYQDIVALKAGGTDVRV